MPLASSNLVTVSAMAICNSVNYELEVYEQNLYLANEYVNKAYLH